MPSRHIHKPCALPFKNYNVAAQTLVPPQPSLSWDDIIKYAFIAGFNLLCNTQSDVHLKVWAKLASCLLMDQHFKMLQAEEEIVWLNIEIPCLTTFIHDEETFLLKQEEKLQRVNFPLSHQVHLQCLKFIQYNNLHISKLCKLSCMQGFSGNINPRTRMESALVQTQPHTDVQQAQCDLLTQEAAAVQDHIEEAGEKEAEEEEEDMLAGAEVIDAFCVVVKGLPHF